ncbi:hypothetical protein BLNAU_9552 [Blattamonas nauphoetae]|uniref:Uncharacterized protein n=1 Tax=Blattamonas nauphoetae TaxID=2049346 RepID=A0ABQ9XVL1_9EUKA|nr:hypothetical protein BLNAU_9552 [Blattamonas nauphoetae]
MDCSPFLNWEEGKISSGLDNIVIFRSLVATIKFQPTLDVSLEEKAVRFLESVSPYHEESDVDLLNSLATFSDESMTDFVQDIVVLISPANQLITATTIELMDNLILLCSYDIRFALIKADLIPRLINTLNPQSFSISDCEDMHTCLMGIITNSFRLAGPNRVSEVEIEDDDERKSVHETVLKQVLSPSEKSVGHLCTNPTSIVDGDQSKRFLIFLARLLRMSPYHQPIMDLCIELPIVLAIPSCLTIFEKDEPIWDFLLEMVKSQREWNKQGGVQQHMWRTVDRMLRMEDIEDVIEQWQLNDQHRSYGGLIAFLSMEWNNLLGTNIVEQE